MKLYKASNLRIDGTFLTVEIEGEGAVTANLLDWPKLISMIGDINNISKAKLLPPDSIVFPGDVQIGADDVVLLATARDAYLAGQLKPKWKTSMKASIVVTSVRVVGPFMVEVEFESGAIHKADFRQIPLDGIFRRAQIDLNFANSAEEGGGYLEFEKGKWTLDSDFLFKHSTPVARP